MSNKESRLSVRVDARLKKRLEDAEKQTGVDEATIVRQCLAAFCDHVEMHGRVVFPLTLGGIPPHNEPRSPILHGFNEPAAGSSSKPAKKING